MRHSSNPLTFLAPAAFMLILALAVFLPVQPADARWGWCLGDPKYALAAVDDDGVAVIGEIWVEVEFPEEYLGAVDSIEATIEVPRNVQAVVDPSSLAVLIDGQPVEGIDVIGNIEYDDDEWDGHGRVMVDVEAIVHSEAEFPVRLKITRTTRDGDMVTRWSKGESGEQLEKDNVPVALTAE